MTTKSLSCTLLLLCAMFIGDQARADESKGDESEIGLTDFLILEGIMAATFALTAHDPEGWGSFFIITSPLVFVDYETRGEYWLYVATSAAYGLWLVDQDGEKESDVFEKQFLAFNALIMPFLIYNKLFDKDEPAEPSKFFIEADPVNYGIRLSYRVEF